jgi:protein-disulfide isomerase-like protein with CxxC motif
LCCIIFRRTNYFISLAAELGINKDKFSEHLDSASIRKKIDYDLAVGAKAGVGGTPALFIGKKDVGNQKVSNGKIISTSKTDSNATYVWANADDFEKYVIVPALKEHGIALPREN